MPRTSSPTPVSVPAIELRGVSRRFTDPGGQNVGVQPTSLAVPAGEIHGIIGFSGAGKSTLLRLVNLLERPDAGEVIVHGQDLTRLSAPALRQARHRIGMIFQHFNLLHNLTVAENVALPMRLSGEPAARIRERVAACLDFVGLSAKADVHPGRLSGGQKQRVAIARALAPEPHVLLADEPTSALDPRTTLDLLGVLADANRRFGVTILLVSHEMEVIRRLGHRVSVMEAGQIVEQLDIADGRIPEGSRLGGWLAEFGGAAGGASSAPDEPAPHHLAQESANA
ncbi:methionine ABC transporter ATP-binding protein [Zoogloea sp. LCSB751]|uniref:methionine ABC transporter ATP-binding protein n=1 Tax=Zoogloea sp. LCSB751 TaxID=1965277 RepID=UPI0009A4CB17|nr:ATP-binding cassette domain-containing protein [Zoogloea sp. LCSB751]